MSWNSYLSEMFIYVEIVGQFIILDNGHRSFSTSSNVKSLEVCLINYFLTYMKCRQ